MLNVEVIEKLAKIRGKNLISLYLNTNRKNFSPLSIKTKTKDLLKCIKVDEKEKRDLEEKIFGFLDRLSVNTKSIAIFAAENFFQPFVFSLQLEDCFTVDSFFNLEPLLLLLSENRSMAVLLLDSEKARFFSIFLGELEAHRHIEDQMVRKQKQGGWSEERFERHREEIIKKHLKNSADFLVKMHKVHKFEYLLLRSDPELESEFIKILPEEIKKKIKGEIKVDINAPIEEIIEKAMELEEKVVIKEEKSLTKELADLVTRESGKVRAVSGLSAVLNSLYNKRISTLLINEGLSEPGTYCTFCGYISLSEEFCPYDQTPNIRARNIFTVLLGEALKQNIQVEVFKDDETLRDLGNIAAFLKEH